MGMFDRIKKGIGSIVEEEKKIVKEKAQETFGGIKDVVTGKPTNNVPSTQNNSVAIQQKI